MPPQTCPACGHPVIPGQVPLYDLTEAPRDGGGLLEAELTSQELSDLRGLYPADSVVSVHFLPEGAEVWAEGRQVAP